MDKRVTELEVKISFTEHQLDELNATVYRQQQMLDALQNELRLLRQQLQANAPTEEWGLRDEIPPHY